MAATTIGPIAISAGADDGCLEINSGVWGMYNTLTEVYVGEWENEALWGFMRFTLPSAIPAGSVVTNAYLHMISWSANQWTTGQEFLRVYATQSADAPRPTVIGDRPTLSGGNTVLASASVRWPVTGLMIWPPVNNNFDMASADISALIQELVDDYGGLSSGAHITLWVATYPDSNIAAAEAAWAAYEHTTLAPPALVIEYSPSSLPATATDDFNRGSIGAAWTTAPGATALSIASNKVYGSVSNGYNVMYRNDIAASDDQCSQAKLVDLVSGGGLIVRLQPASDVMYALYATNRTTLYISRMAGGTESVLWTGTVSAFTASTVVQFRAVGATLSVFFDGVLKQSITINMETSALASGYVGIYAYGTSDSIDDWSGGSYGAAVYTETLNSSITSLTSLTALQTFGEQLLSTVAAIDSIIDVRLLVEQLQSTAASTSVETSVQTYLDALQTVVVATDSLTDAFGYLEQAQTTIQSAASLDVVQAHFEAVVAVGTAQSGATDVQAMVETINTAITSSASLAEVASGGEMLSTVAQGTGAAQDVQTYVEQLQSLIQSATTISELQAMLETVNTVGASASALTDVIAYVETLLSVAVSVSAVNEGSSLTEILTSTGIASAATADLQTYVETLNTGILSLSTIEDRALLLENLAIMALSSATIAEMQAYVETLITTITSGGTATDVLVGSFIGSYIRVAMVTPRAFETIVTARSFSSTARAL